MTCAEARERMLEADRTDLERATGSELSEHLRDCPRCRAAANRILEAERQLTRSLAAATPRRAAGDAMELARRRAWRRRWVRRLAPLAAAAAVAAVLLRPRRPVERALPPASMSPARSDLAVEAPPGRSVAVFQTDNPDIVVIWFF